MNDAILVWKGFSIVKVGVHRFDIKDDRGNEIAYGYYTVQDCVEAIQEWL